MRRRFALSLAATLAVASAPVMAGTLKSLVHPPPDGAIITMLLTDGTVMAQGGNANDWWKLTPDNKGSYVNGTWTQLASFPSGYAPYANAESVLPDGRVVMAGGEYNNFEFSFTNQSMIYDPLTNKWTDITPGHFFPFIGDSPSNVLPDGRFVVGEKFKEKVFALDAKTLTWSELPSTNKNDFNAEEGWLLMPDNSILTVDVKDHPQSERYLIKSGKWVTAGSTVVDLRGPQDCCGHCIQYGPKGKCYDPPGETGGSVLRPDGTVFAAGSTPDGGDRGHTAIYTPPSKGDKHGHWTAG
ncbi:MAG TPA: kelch repeat-containing protein, partial [Rhizomicrobium sp.]